MIFYYMLVIVLSLIISFASFFIKKASAGLTFLSLSRSKFFYFGAILYFIGTIFNIWLLKRIPYSVFMPLGSVTYIWTMLIAWFFLDEKIGKSKIAGVLLICFGVICITFQ